MNTPSSSSHALRYFVSPQGSDRWSGTLAEPNVARTDGPWLTPQHATHALRTLKAQHPHRPIRVLLRGGRYELASTWQLTPPDSGSAHAPITYAAYPGEQPVLSGGRILQNWTLTHHLGKPCWITHLPEVQQGHWHFQQLFVNGERRLRPRLPKQGFDRFTGFPEGKPGFWNQVQSIEFAPGKINPDWHNLRDIQAIALQHWFDSHLHLDTVDPINNIVRFQAKAICDLNDEEGKPARYYLENVFEALTEPGEWYLDRTSGLLYYLPMGGEHPDNTTVIAPRLDYLLRLDGEQSLTGQRVTHVRFEGLDFREAEWVLPTTNGGAVQSAYNITGAIILRAAEDCVLFRCRVSRIAQYAIEIQRMSTRNRIIGCHLHDLGAGGIKVNHELGMIEGLIGTTGLVGLDIDAMGWGPLTKTGQERWQDAHRIPHQRAVLTDNVIHDGCKIYFQAIGIWVGDAGHCYIAHNHIFNFSYTTISVGWTWGFSRTRTVNNRIQANHLHDIGRGHLSDLGGIYTLGHQPGTIIRRNHIHHVDCNGYGASGVYLDEGSAYILVEHNVTHHTKSGGFVQHYGRDNYVRHNIFTLAKDMQIEHARQMAVRTFSLTDNIFYATHPRMISAVEHTFLDRNLYFCEGGSPAQINGETLARRQHLGLEPLSLEADPKLQAPHSGLFALAPDSPALAMGFPTFDTHDIGPRPAVQRTLCFDDWHDALPPAEPIVEVRLERGKAEQLDSDPLVQPIKPTVYMSDEDQSLPFYVIVRNAGDVPAQGRVDLLVEPASSARIDGATHLDYTLAPAQTQTLQSKVHLTGQGKAQLIARMTGAGTIPESLIYIAPQPRLTVQTGLPMRELSQVAQALRSLEPQVLRVKDEQRAALRLALTDDQHLAIHVMVHDSLRRSFPQQPWAGSCVELFTSPDRVEKAQQFFLLPATGGQTASASLMLNWPLTPAPSIRLQSHDTAQGYEILALVPMALVTLPTDGSPWRFNALFHIATPGDTTHQSHWLYPGDHLSNRTHALVKST